MNKKHHHHLPIAYLKPWCDEKGKVFLYRKDNPTKPTHQLPDNVCHRRYYYSQPLPDGGVDHNRIEDYFSKFETTWPRIVERLEPRENVNDVLPDILMFIMLQFVRGPAARDAIEARLAEMYKASLLNLDAAGQLPPKPEGCENIIYDADLTINPNQSIVAMPTVVEGMGPLLQRVGIGVLHNITDIPFLTSDNPVVWFDPSVAEDKMQPYSLQDGGPMILLFPLTPRLMIYGDSLSREKFAQYGIGHGELSKEIVVEEMNRQICRFAYEAVISQRPGQEALVSQYADVSPVMQTQTVPYEHGFLTSFRPSWGKRKRKPKWKDDRPMPDTEPGTHE